MTTMTVLSDGTVVVCGTENNQLRLKRFSLQTRRELGSTDLNNAHGLTEVKLGGKITVAVSDR